MSLILSHSSIYDHPELAGISLKLIYTGKNGIRYRLHYQPQDFKYPLNLRLDFTFVSKVSEPTTSPLVTRFPLGSFPIVSHLSTNEILAEKLRAIDKQFEQTKFLSKLHSYPSKKITLDLAQFLPKSHKKILPLLPSLLDQQLASHFSSTT